ncbi:MAG: ABC transporter ATP-binding protein [Alphaproteobacteria bacterium]
MIVSTGAKIISLLDAREKISALGLLGLIVVTAVIETAGIASIVPFLAVMADPSIIERQPLLNAVYEFSGLADKQSFLFALGFGVLIVLVVTNAVSAAMSWAIARFTHMRTHMIACRLLVIYLHQPYQFFLGRDSSEMAKNILIEVSHVVKNAVVAGMQIIARLVTSVFIMVLLVIIDPKLALIVAGVLGIAYMILYLFIHRRLASIGDVRIDSNARRFKIFSEIFASIKDIKVSGREENFIKRFEEPSRRNSLSYAQYDVISTFPRYVLETFAFGALLAICLYLMAVHGEFPKILPIIGLYAFAGQRLMPSLQNIFLNISKIRYVMPSLDNLCRELSLTSVQSQDVSAGEAALPFESDIALKNVSFRFETSDQKILDHLAMSIQKNTSVGIVGGTGAGKSTLIDVILGLLDPQEGTLEIDGSVVSPHNVRQWQRNIGYVSQNIILLHDTVRHNTAFGYNDDEIDDEAVERVLRAAHLNDFIRNETPAGYDTVIGENGVRLSGGQRQRLGLARALYRDPPVLILDEATSALDNITESAVIEALDNLTHRKTIIMIAHRLSTVQNCDVIHYLEKGRVIASGSYDALMEGSQEFRRLARAGQG